MREEPRHPDVELSPVQARVALNLVAGLDQLLEQSVLDEHQIALLMLSYSIANPKAVEMLRGAIANLKHTITG